MKPRIAMSITNLRTDGRDDRDEDDYLIPVFGSGFGRVGSVKPCGMKEFGEMTFAHLP
jgi:hypothetical protein